MCRWACKSIHSFFVIIRLSLCPVLRSEQSRGRTKAKIITVGEWRKGVSLKVLGEIGEACQLEELLASGGLIDDFVFEDPGEVVGNEDGVEPCAECGVDVGAGAVSNHPGIAGFTSMVGG